MKAGQQKGSRDEAAPGARALEVRELGTVSYSEGIALQETLVGRRRGGEIPDQLLLLEHPHVITVGTGGGMDHVIADDGELRLLGIELCRTGRGGDVTYHGPGQLVGYPILDLKPHRKDLHRYLRDLEQVLIEALATFGITGERSDGLTGVWVEGRKIAALGVRVSSGWITSHGFALNVATDLRYFETIVPCGIHDRTVTSLSEALGRVVTTREVIEAVVPAFERVFELRHDSCLEPPG